MHVVSMATEARCPGAIVAQHRLRYRIFVQRLGWHLPTFDGLEYDEYDNPTATYLVWRDADGEARGVARLIPTAQPYMLQKLWPELCSGYLPNSATIWEGSRFGVDHQVSPELRDRICRELIIGCLEFGLDRGISEYLVLMPAFFVRRQIGGAGCQYRLLGQTQQFGRVQMAVAAVDVTVDALANARCRAGITSALLDAPRLQESAA